MMLIPWTQDLHPIKLLLLLISITVILSTNTGDDRITEDSRNSISTGTQSETNEIIVDNDVTNRNDHEMDKFLMACSQGELDIVQQYTMDDPSYVTRYSKNGETCLHVAAILGQSSITKYILQLPNSNVNQRSIYEHGLRMTPLAWNIYGLHITNIQLLLQYNANVNLDFDYMTDKNIYEKVTPLDLIYIMAGPNIQLDNLDDIDADNDNNSDKAEYVKKLRTIRDLLIENGGKRYVDLPKQREEDGEEVVIEGVTIEKHHTIDDEL